MLTVGMDVHVRNSFLPVRDGQGRTLLSRRCGNDFDEIAQTLGPLEALGQPLRVVLESTTNSRPIARLVERYGHAAGLDLTVHVLDARKLRVIADSVNKCDRLDAAVLAELAGSNLKLPVCYMPDDEVFALREHLRARADLVRLRTMLKNRVHALLHRRNLLTPASDLFTKGGRAWLAQAPLDEAGRAIVDRYLQQLDAITQAVLESTQQVRRLSLEERWRHVAALAQSMPGVGLITAMTILAELGDLSRFASRSAVSRYAGLTPRQHDSNDTHRGGHISKQGPCHLRRVLVEAAWQSVNRVPHYQAMYERIKHRRGASVAIVAIARRMLEDQFTMLTQGQAFRHQATAAQGLAPGRAG